MKFLFWQIIVLLTLSSCAINSKTPEEEYRLSKQELCENKDECSLTLPKRSTSDYVEYYTTDKKIHSIEIPIKVQKN